MKTYRFFGKKHGENVWYNHSISDVEQKYAKFKDYEDLLLIFLRKKLIKTEGWDEDIQVGVLGKKKIFWKPWPTEVK